MSENKNREILSQILKDMEDFAEMKNIDYPPMYLLGGSGCIIGGYLDRATTDFDLLDMEYSSNVGSLLRILGKLDLLDQYLTTIPHDFPSRAIKIEQFNNIYILSKEDIILSKIGRYSKIDIEDISKLIQTADIELIRELINKVLERKNISQRVKEEFTKNLKLFKERFHV